MKIDVEEWLLKKLNYTDEQIEAIKKSELGRFALLNIVDEWKKLDGIVKAGSIQKTSESNIKEIMQPTCYKSIAYCCGLEKPCSTRDFVLELLGISKEEYTKLKDSWTEEVIELILKKGE